jgi:hypothetical protein
MMHMWRRDLGKNTDNLFTVPGGVHFWGGSQFKPLIVAFVFPLAHVSDYTGPRALKGTYTGLYHKHALKEAFKQGPKELGAGGTHPRDTCGQDSRGVPGSSPSAGGDLGQQHFLDNDLEAGSRALLRKLLASAGQPPPCRSVWWGKCYRESQTITSPGWTTCKAARTWKLTWPTHGIGMNVARMATNSWGYLSSATSACSEMWWEEIQTIQAIKMNSYSQP